jgi:hypothetical protein
MGNALSAGLALIAVIVTANLALAEAARTPRSREQCQAMANARAYVAVSGRQRAARGRFMKRCMAGKGVNNVKR